MQEGTNSLRKLRRDWWKTKLCTACVSPLGRFLSRGGTCPQCGLRVCKNCRVESQTGVWVCVLCSSGGMPSDDVAKTTKSLGRDSRSIRRSWTISNPQRTQTNSPILKSYTVLYPEEGGVTADGGSGSCAGAGNGCSISTGYLSTLEDGEEHPSGSAKNKRLLFGGSEQGLNSTNRNRNNNRSVNIIGHHHHHHHQQGRAINQSNELRGGGGGRGNGNNNDEIVNGTSRLRQFHSLPRMSSNSAGSLSLFAPSSSSPSGAARALGLSPANKTAKRSFNKEFDKENIKRHRSFQTTLHPYNPSQVNNPPSPAASVNFIEEIFWDYYDNEYENSSSDPGSTPRNLRRTVTAAAISESSSAKRSPPHNSNRSSCERSLGETMDYDCSLRMNQFASMSDPETGDGGGKRGENRNQSAYTTLSPEYRRRGETTVHPHPRSSYHYATISSSTNPYLPASEYVYRRRHHDHEMPNEPPPKPERKFRNSKRSVSLNAYDGRKLFSPLRTYCVLMKENIEPGNNTENDNAAAGPSNPLSNNHIPPESSPQQRHSADPTRTTTTTSAIMNNTSPISLSFTSTNSAMKFNSLPRERYIRIEREDGDGSSNTDKFFSLKYPSSRKSDTLLLGKGETVNRERNVTRVPINKDDSGNDLNFPTNHRTNNFTFTPPKSRIERSQSYREISSRPPFPHYHTGVSTSATSQNTLPRHHNQLSANSLEKSTSNTGPDLNFIPPAGTTSTLPNFRTGRVKPPRTTIPSTAYSVWDSGNKSDSGSFFRSEFDDGSDVVIENFIKVHSNNVSNNNLTGNTFPKRKYPPTTTHISSSSPQHQQRRASDDNEYSNTSTKSSDPFQQVDPSNNYLRQCSTFPRGNRTKNKEPDAPAEKQTEQLPNFHKKSINAHPPPNQRNNSPPSGDKQEAFFHPSMSAPPKTSSVTLPHSSNLLNNNVPKQQSEKSVPIKVGLTGPGSSATLPHPYIRRNKQLSINSNSPTNNGIPNNDTKPRTGATSTPSKGDSGPSISEVEMEIERDIFFQKTKSLDRVRPSSKSKLKSVLSLGRGNHGTVIDNNNHAANLHYPMEIDYSDSQPYSSIGRLSSHQQDNIFSIDQVDRKHANPRANGTSKSTHAQASPSTDQLKPQQVHHNSSNSSAPMPIPSPRLKRKAKLQQNEPISSSSSLSSSQHANRSNTLCSPKINGDEMSSSTSPKLIGPGTSYGSEKLPYFPPSTDSPHGPNEPDPYNQPQQQHYQSQGVVLANGMDHPSTGFQQRPTGSTASNPIVSGNGANLNASSKLSFAKDTSIKTDHQLSSPTTVFNGMSNSNGVDAIMKSERGTSAPNHISQPSGSATLNYSNSDSPGVNFMISNSPLSTSPSVGELEWQSQQQQPFSSLGSKEKTPAAMMHHVDFPSSQQIKSALANSSGADSSSKLGSAGGGAGKAVRFEPHVIAMEIESEQRKLLQQQQLSGTGGPVSTHNNSNNNGINSAADGGGGGASSNNGNGGGMKSNSGHHNNNVHRHVYGNKGRHHYVHASSSSSSYLPVLYHSYHNQQHKYIRKGSNGNVIAGGGPKSGKKSKKYKGFVARAIAKVKSKAANIKKDSSSSSSSTTSSTSTASPTVYYPVQQGSKGTTLAPTIQPTQSVNNNIPPSSSATSSSSSVITYISPKPQTQHSQPPAQHSLDEVTAAQQQAHSNVPRITVSLTSTSEEGGGIQSLNGQSKKYYTTPSGKLKKSSPSKAHKVSGGLISGSKLVSSVGGPGGARRMDGYLDSRMLISGNETNDSQSQYPDSFSLHSDRITPSSTSSSSSSSFTSNLQESYELFHNHTIPDSVSELVANATIMAPSPDQQSDSVEIDEHSDSLDQESDNANEEDDDPHFTFKSFDESDSENEEPDFVFYPMRPKPTDSVTTTPSPSSSVRPHHNNIDDMNRKRVITSVASSTDGDSYAPFPTPTFSNETTTKGNNNNNIISEVGRASAPLQDPTRDSGNSSMRTKGKSMSAEPKMVVGIPTYRSPNSRRLINSHTQATHYGKSQPSVPNANPTISNLPKSINENVKLKSSSSSQSSSTSSSLYREPHPLLHQDTFSTSHENITTTKEDSVTPDRSNNNRHDSPPGKDTNIIPSTGSPGMKGLSKHCQPTKTENVLREEKSQPFLPMKTRNSKGRHYENERDRAAEGNADHDHEAEDTSQKTNAVDANGRGNITTHVCGDDDDDDGSCKKERVTSLLNPHDAGKKSCEGIASAATSTGQNTPSPPQCNRTIVEELNNEGRLTDLTTTTTSTSATTRSSRGQEQLAAPKNADSINDEEGLRHGSPTTSTVYPSYVNKDAHPSYNISTLVDNVEGRGNKLLRDNLQHSEESSSSSVLQARNSSTSSWASNNKKKTHPSGAPPTSVYNASTKTQASVTNNGNENVKDDHTVDAETERLRRLELVKRQQHLFSGEQKASFKFSDKTSSANTANSDSQRGDNNEFGGRETATPTEDQGYSNIEQPNSLETQCANDQSFLSESEVSSCGKSPTPSPRFRCKKPGNRGGGNRVHPKFQQRSSPSPNEKESPARSSTQHGHHHHLLNSDSEERRAGGSPPYTEEEPIILPDPPGSGGPAGMSILPPSLSVSDNNGSGGNGGSTNFGKFKSRVLLNSDDLEDDEELSRAVADAISNSKVANGTKNRGHPSSISPSLGKKNVTTVEISGDVGIVSNNVPNNFGNSGPPSYKHEGSNKNASSIHNRHHHHQHHVSNEHLQSSGLSFIQQPSLLDLNSDNESFVDDLGGIIAIEKPIEPEIKTKLVDKVVRRSLSEEVGSSVSANESGSGDNDTEKTSDDNSSDWQSESTNTVIFRGNLGVVDSDHPFYRSPSYHDPEIQINNITVGDDDESFLRDEENAGSEHSGLSASKVNVGHKATKVNKVSTDLIIGLKTSTTDNAFSSSSTAEDSHTLKIGSKRKFDKNNDLSSSSSSAGDSSEELGKSNETLTDIPVHEGSHTQQEQVISQHPLITEEVEEQDHLEVKMVIHPDKKIVNGGNRHFVQGNTTKSPHHRRESPEGQEQEVPDRSFPEDSKSATKPTIPPPLPPSHMVKEQIIEQSNSAVVPNAKEKKMEENGGGSTGGGGNGPNDGSTNSSGSRSKKKSSSRGTINKEKILQTMLSQIPSRSSPDGADADKSDATPEPEVESPTPAGVIDTFDVTSDEDSWVEEILFEDEDDTSFEEAVKKLPPPLDLTLHTIVEESCEESEAENSGNFYQPSTSGLGGSQKNPSLSQSESNANELEKYFNFGIYPDPNSGGKNSLHNEESEFSDTFSESSFSLQEDDFTNDTQAEGGLVDPAELASTRLEKYFYNLGGPQSMMNPMNTTIINQHAADSDSVGSESDSDNSLLEKRKKVLKHHRRSADFDDEFGDKVSDEEESFGFGQDGFDTIKKTARKTKKSGSEGSINNDSNYGSSAGGNQNSSEIANDQATNASNFSSSIFETKSPKPQLKKSDSESSSSNKASSNPSGNEKPVIKVNRSNSFTWSSDEEVNIMMSKLRQLIKNLIKSKAEAGNSNSTSAQPTTSSHNAFSSESGGTGANPKDKQLVYLENELIRLMKTDNLKNIVEYLSSEESDVDDVYKFIKVVNSSGSTPVDLDDLGDLGDLDIDDPNLLENLQSTMQQDGSMGPGSSPKSSPALLAKVMHHIGNRLNMWMKDEGTLEDDNNDDTVTLKCAPSVSSDLNEDRFSWKGSFESALAAKRQSVGSTDSISSSDYGQDKSMLRSSSLHHLTTSQPIEENKEEEEPASSLPRMTNLCNSLPRLNQPNNPAISRAHSLVMTAGRSEQPTGTEPYPVSISGPVKSARYRPPGFQPSMKAKRIDTEEKASPAILSQSTPVLTQDSAILKNRSDSMGSIFNDVKPLISVKGQVEFGLQYNYKLACLEVKVTGCRDLAAADSKRNRSDPYVKAYLLPDKSKAGKRKTKTKKNTLNPVFDEILKFPLTLSDLQNRTLWLSVWHSDMFGKNEFLGEILVSLKDRVFDDPNPGWWELQEMSGQMEDMPKGDVVIALKWQPKTDSTGNLSVLVKEAKNLVPVKNGSPSTFVKCALLSEKTRKQKTSICRRNFNPIWNQTLLFEDVDDEGVEVTIWNHDLLASHDLIGTVRLEYDSSLWESMLSRPSFWVEGVLKLS